MIIAKQTIIDGKQFLHTYSDTGFMIERDGQTYIEAIDPIEFDRIYTETTEKIPSFANELTDTEALNIIMGRDEDATENSNQIP